MACWFPMALKGGALSWLLNLPRASITSSDDLHERFIANFQGNYDRAPTMNDLRCIKKAEEGLMSLLGPQVAEPEEKKTKA
ncbi:hypothetical protein ZWY2020_041918 [Hordeum vulgare]|nr:hypothetical protein ZWY2020_041918 [Hordeum vulgare]